ncbi:MAG TPA: hypothetical protein VJT67_03785 [Longimicrobiaceae bacterium]|nr:hypothetical protein [Longimicrobiaceae bacterium]
MSFSVTVIPSAITTEAKVCSPASATGREREARPAANIPPLISSEPGEASSRTPVALLERKRLACTDESCSACANERSRGAISTAPAANAPAMYRSWRVNRRGERCAAVSGASSVCATAGAARSLAAASTASGAPHLIGRSPPARR